MSPARICLVNMPFASPEAPSIALTQLKSVLDQQFGGRVSVEVLYLDLDFLEYTGGLANYQRMISSQGRLAGAADWFFRKTAFPDSPDNTAAYLDRFYFEDDEETTLAKQFLVEKRPGVTAFLDELIEKHRLQEAHIVGFTSLFFQTMASFAMGRRIKERNPDVITVIGGAACETEMGLEYAKQVDQIDFVFSGPALVSFPRFVEKQLAGDVEACDRIHGVFSKTNLSACRGGSCGCENEMPGGGNRVALMGEEKNINVNVPLDYHAFLDRFDDAFPGDDLRPMLLFETSRGCSWGEKVACTFCGLNGMAMHYRSMTPENALSQIRGLYDYLPRCNFFLAVDTIVPGEYLEEVFPQLDPPPRAAMMYEVRSALTENQLQTLCGAGVYVIQPGIESLATSTLRLMRKGATAFGNIRFLKRCTGFPLRVEWNLLVGSPGEEEGVYEKYLEILPRLAHLHPPTGAFPISFDRFSQYFSNPEEYNLDLQPHEYYRFAYPLEPASLANIAYHFVDRNADPEKLDPWLDRLNEVIARWWIRWENRDGRHQPQLRLIREGGGSTIYDSRTGNALEYPVTETSAAFLEYLDTPRPREHAATRFGKEVTECELRFLREKGLLFEERGRLLSLVHLTGGPNDL